MELEATQCDTASTTDIIPGPLSLVAEVTHRRPLHCVYCSNPLHMQSADTELSTEDWFRVFHQASALGALHLHLTGGEPLARPDIAKLVAAGREANLYVNMITSGLGLTADRMQELKDAGLEHIQLSLQDAEKEKANEFAGARAHAHKLKLATLIREQDIAFTVNVVVHRENLDRSKLFSPLRSCWTHKESKSLVSSTRLGSKESRQAHADTGSSRTIGAVDLAGAIQAERAHPVTSCVSGLLRALPQNLCRWMGSANDTYRSSRARARMSLVGDYSGHEIRFSSRPQSQMVVARLTILQSLSRN